MAARSAPGGDLVISDLPSPCLHPRRGDGFRSKGAMEASAGEGGARTNSCDASFSNALADPSRTGRSAPVHRRSMNSRGRK